jgi:hypothetical protein
MEGGRRSSVTDATGFRTFLYDPSDLRSPKIRQVLTLYRFPLIPDPKQNPAARRPYRRPPDPAFPRPRPPFLISLASAFAQVAYYPIPPGNPPATRKHRSEGAEFDSMRSCASLRQKWGRPFRAGGKAGGVGLTLSSLRSASRRRGNVPSASFGRGVLLRRFARELASVSDSDTPKFGKAPRPAATAIRGRFLRSEISPTRGIFL